MKQIVVIACVWCAVVIPVLGQPLDKIAFGSCSHQDKDQMILNRVVEQDPDLFIYLGDNIYGDTEDMEVMRAKYQQLSSIGAYQALKTHCPLVATWDDHDYGVNDGGSEYPMKEESKEAFLEFWEEPEGSDRWKREGIYTAYLYGEPGKRVQVILLDTRTFRSALKGEARGGNYTPNVDPDATMLGEAQWQWLEEQLRVPADLRIIGSSIQYAGAAAKYEKWGNFPKEQKRMAELIKKTGAEQVFFISGDRHFAEVSKLEVPKGYPLYDFTSSGLTQSWDGFGPNPNRVGKGYGYNNFGVITINWAARSFTVTIHDEQGKPTHINTSIAFEDLGF